MTEKTIKDLIEDYRRAVVALERDGGVATAECVEIAQSKLEAGLRARQAPAPVEVSKLIPELAAAGWMLVPTVATTKQRLAMAKADGESGDRYRNMAAAFISAAPVPPNTILASMASTPVGEVPTCVGDTRFEGWLGCHEPDRRDGRRPAYTKQDMRDAYWAGYTERAASPAPAASKGAEAADDPELLALAERAVEAMAKRTPEEASAGFASWIMGPGGSEGTTSTPPPEPEAQKAVEPIDMVLHCPACGLQHIDAPEADGQVPFGEERWTNPPHHSHLCHGCGHIWRPADVPTNGVAAIKTRGQNDSPSPAASMEVQGLTVKEIIQLWAHRSDGPDNAEIVSYAEDITRALAAKNGWRLGEGRG